MRIVVYTHYFTPEIGAPSARIFEFSRKWVEDGHEVQVVTCFPNHPTGRLYKGYRGGHHMKECFSGVHVHRNWTYVTPNQGVLKKTLGHVSFLPSAFLFSNQKLLKPDVVMATSPTFFAAMAGAWAGMYFRVPFVMDVRDLWPAIFVELGVLKNKFLIRLLEKLELSLYRKATRVVTVTDAFRDNLMARGVPQGKVNVVTNGADTDFWQPAARPLGLMKRLGLEGQFVVLYMGAHGISHGLTKILDAAFLLRDDPDIRFLFVGAGAEKARLILYAEELGLKNVLFRDPVDKKRVKEFYQLANVCLVPLKDIPLFKTFIPSKMFEIMAMERPVIASLAGEPADILKRSKGAVVVQPEDSRAVSAAVRYLYENPDTCEVLGKQGRQFVHAHYSRKTLADRYVEVFRKAVAGYGCPP